MTADRSLFVRFVNRSRMTLLLSAALTPAAALAHPGHHVVHSVAAGASHPWLGLDHLLAMLLVGVWAARLGGRARWLLPSSFVSAMVLGSMASGAIAMPAFDHLIALSVLLLGAVIAMTRQVNLYAAGAVVALAALFHGHAHGVEAPAGEALSAFTAGFAISTAVLHAMGLALGHALLAYKQEGILKALGAGAALAGALMMAS